MVNTAFNSYNGYRGQTPPLLSRGDPPTPVSATEGGQGRGLVDIANYEGLYSINEYGEVWSHRRQRWLAQNDAGRGWLKTELWKNGLRKTCKIHRLVAQTFIDNPDNKPAVNHIDCDKANNHVSNLEWCTAKENTEHAIANGLFWSQKRSTNG